MGIGGDQSGSIRVVGIEWVRLPRRNHVLTGLASSACFAFWYRWFEADIWVGPDHGCHQYRGREGHYR